MANMEYGMYAVVSNTINKSKQARHLKVIDGVNWNLVAWKGIYSKIGCIPSPLVHVTSAKSPQITPLLDTNEVLGECKT